MGSAGAQANATQQAANANAAGTVGSANAITSALGNTANNLIGTTALNTAAQGLGNSTQWPTHGWESSSPNTLGYPTTNTTNTPGYSLGDGTSSIGGDTGQPWYEYSGTGL
jgi:hypothetical protein